MNITAYCYRSENWWAIEIPELSHVYSQARRLDQVEDMVRDAASLHTGQDPASFVITVIPHLDADDEDIIKVATERKHAALTAAQAAAEANRAVVLRLRAQGLPVRDVATLMGISPQRVSKIAA